MKLYDTKISAKDKRRSHKFKNRRFLSQLDMSIIKHDIAAKNSEIKRGERARHAVTGITMCGCGGIGCAIHYDVY